MGVDNYLKERYDYNIRERMNIYAGIALGIAIPIIITRYSAFSSSQPGSIVPWILSAPCSFFGCPPLIGTTIAGLIVGSLEAHRLKGIRMQKQHSKLEEKTFLDGLE